MAIPTTPPSGFRDFLPDAAAVRAHAAEVIAGVYRSFGFQRIATSAFEDLAVLLGKGGGENEKLIFKVMRRGEQLEKAKAAGEELADMGLRFDLTVPLARYYSKYGSTLPHPFKAFQLGPVWRAERAQKGRFREFWQCDADVIGSDAWHCEVEVISALVTAVTRLGVEHPRVLINDRSLVYALLEQAGVEPDRRLAACVILDKLDKLERGQVLAELTALVGEPAAKSLEASLLAEAPDLALLRAAAPAAVDRLEKIVAALRALSAKPESFVLQPSLMRGFDYYTGPVFELHHPSLSSSLGGGGRYDRLTEKFGGQPVPACGGSIGFERLLLILEESGQAPGTSAPDAVVTVFSEELRLPSLQLAARLRAAGLAIDVYPGSGKLKAQFKYADQKKAAHCLVLGPDEAAQGLVKVKEMKTGAEEAVKVDELAARLRR
ncbi:MAG TPA: histidine--tRNA ligase [Polyangia bacterium]|nr:histidine--tRNA ligase [Polyangia bacterium]